MSRDRESRFASAPDTAKTLNLSADSTPPQAPPEGAAEEQRDSAAAGKAVPLSSLRTVQGLQKAGVGQRTIECFRPDLIAQTRGARSSLYDAPESSVEDVPTRRIKLEDPPLSARAESSQGKQDLTSPRPGAPASSSPSVTERLLVLLCICLSALSIALSLLYTVKSRGEPAARPSSGALTAPLPGILPAVNTLPLVPPATAGAPGPDRPVSAPDAAAAAQKPRD